MSQISDALTKLQNSVDELNTNVANHIASTDETTLVNQVNTIQGTVDSMNAKLAPPAPAPAEPVTTQETTPPAA